MSVSRKRLSSAQVLEYVSCLRSLQAEGIGVDIPDEWVDHSRALDVLIAPSPLSMVFEWPGGGAGYAVWVRLLSRKRCVFEDCELRVSWDDQIIIQSLDERKSQCEFGNLAFSSEKVLNHRIENTLRFPRAGHLVEGVILARSVLRIPEEYTSGRQVPFTLTLYDQYGEETSESGHLQWGNAPESAKRPS